METTAQISSAYVYPLISEDEKARLNSRMDDPVWLVRFILLTTYDVSLEDVSIRCRTRAVKHFRQAVQALLRNHTKLSLTQIGLETGGFDHATVLNSKRKVEEATFIFAHTGLMYPLLEIYKALEKPFVQLYAPPRRLRNARYATSEV